MNSPLNSERGLIDIRVVRSPRENHALAETGSHRHICALERNDDPALIRIYLRDMFLFESYSFRPNDWPSVNLSAATAAAAAIDW